MAMKTTAPITHVPLGATDERRTETRPPDGSPAHRPPSRTEGIDGFAPLVFAPAFYGPAAIFVLGPWLLLVLLLIGPAALLITFVLVVLVVAGLLVAVGALLASPYLLVRHLRARRAITPGTKDRAPVPQAQPAARLKQPAHLGAPLVSHERA
jgi:hypothetical protein